MRVIIASDYDKVSKWAADYVAYKIKSARPTAKKPFVLGLPAGGSPLGMFKFLIEMYKKGKISFENVVIFNMDEYLGLPQNDINSYHYFLWENFFQHVNIKKKNVHLLNGQTKDFVKESVSYEKLIRSYGGIDLQIGGVGEDGHIAFNEPGSSLGSRTRVKALSKNTIKANARFFDNDETKVPRNAITIGIATIMDAKEVMIIANGKKKTKAIQCTVEGSINHMCPITILQMHAHAILVCDEDAVSELKPEVIRYFKDIEEVKFSD
jgi:glucosamine-6-phosphate deaminase